MARDGIVSALQPMQQPPKLTYSGGAGMASGPGYSPMQGQFGNGYSGMGQQVNYGSGLPQRGQFGGYQGPGPGFMGYNEVSVNGVRPMGFMQPMGFWGGNGGWGSHMSMPTPQPIAAPTGYGSDSDAHGSSAGFGGGLW